MFELTLLLLRAITLACRGHHDVVLENLALRHQLRTLQRRVKRPHLRTRDRMFWVLLATAWRQWRSALVLVHPETVVRWHRTWLRRRWAQRSGRNRAGRPPLDPAVVRLLTDMAGANPLWGAPRIHGELRKLGIEISERTVSRLLAQLSRPPSQPWRTFLANHLSALVSMDFFTVSTLTGRVLFLLVLIAHDRRRHRARQRHRAPHRRVDRPAAGRRLPRGRRSPMAAARPGQHLRRSGASADRQPRHHRGRVESAQPVAESLRGARDRLHSPRVSRPRDHPQPPASPPHASRVSRLLPSEPHASRPEQRRPGRQAGVCRFRPDHRHGGSRRPASPLRSSGRVRDDLTPAARPAAPGVSCACLDDPSSKWDWVRSTMPVADRSELRS